MVMGKTSKVESRQWWDGCGWDLTFKTASVFEACDRFFDAQTETLQCMKRF